MGVTSVTKLTFMERIVVLLTGNLGYAKDCDDYNAECVGVSPMQSYSIGGMGNNATGEGRPHTVIEYRPVTNGSVLTISYFSISNREWAVETMVVPAEPTQPLSELVAQLLVKRALADK